MPGCTPRRPEVFAAGDVANAYHPLFGRHIRVEHWANALNGGPAAARSMLGKGVSYDAVPYFFSDQYDLGMETAGLPEPGSYDQVVYRGDREAREFIAFWLSGGAVVAGMNVNVWDVSRRHPGPDPLPPPRRRGPPIRPRHPPPRPVTALPSLP